ncbi:putative polyketide synthase [Aspergillus crustosus]
MAVRLPGGVHSPLEFWDMLINKRDGRCEVPSTRYNIDGFQHPTKPHSIKTRHGYFLREDPALFDAKLHGGETDWRGGNIGCYVGVFGEDWLELSARDPENIDRYRAIGTGAFVLANRISFEYDLRGPIITIQTGCSASLVGVHEACLALQAGTCTSAVVAGTNLIWAPNMTITMTNNGVLSPEGICRTFDEKANGFGRGEAINAVYIKPLSAAIRDGNPIPAIIRSTCTNFDGRTPNMTTPCPESQEALIRSAYARAATTAGDKVEASVVATLASGRETIIGAVKPNVGHSEGASGLTSLIKAVLALERNTIPPNVYYQKPNPEIPFETSNLVVPVEAMPWPGEKSERVSVNSFGIGGSNVHVILESATSFLPPESKRPALDKPTIQPQPKLLLVSAQSEESLKKIIKQTGNYANSKPISDHRNLAYTLAFGRKHLPHRAFTVLSPGSLIDPSNFQSFSTPPKQPQVFTFTGQGAQWVGMGRDLMQSFDEFRDDIREMDRILDSLENHHRQWSLFDELGTTTSASRVDKAEFAQPLCTALQIGLVNIFTNRFGVKTSAVVGHSSGEIAAAYAAGANTMKSAIIIAYLRGKVVSSLEGSGGMAAIGLGRAVVEQYLSSDILVAIACENSPQSVTLSGDEDGLESFIELIKKDHPDVLCRQLPIAIPYHSSQMSQIGSHYESLMEPLIERQNEGPMIPMFSTVDKKVIRDPDDLNADYWRRNLESPVLFASAVQRIVENKDEPSSQVFLEIGPHPMLAGPCKRIRALSENRSDCLYIPTLKREDQPKNGGYIQLLEAVATAHCHGVSVNLHKIVATGEISPDLPPYPWHYETRHWLHGRAVTDWRMRPAPHHELLGRRIAESSDLEPSWRNVFFREDVEWLEEHVLGGEIIFPAAGFIAMAGEAVEQLHPEAVGELGYSIRRMVLKLALVITPKSWHPVELIASLRPVRLNDTMSSDWYAFTIMAYTGTDWVTHCHGEVRPQFDRRPRRLFSPGRSFPRQVNSERWYQAMRHRGLDYGEQFRGLKDISADPVEMVSAATVTASPAVHQSHYLLHPIVIDQCLQSMSVAWAHGSSRRLEGMGIPVAFEQLYVKGVADTMRVEVSVTKLAQGKQLGRATLQRLISLSGSVPIPLTSQMRWAPDIEFLPMSSLTVTRPVDEDLKQAVKYCILATYRAILMTDNRLRDIDPVLPHLVAWKNWVGQEAAKVRQGMVQFASEVLEFVKLSPEEQGEHYGQAAAVYKISEWQSYAQTIWAICDNWIALALGDISTIDLLMRDDNLVQYFRLNQEMFDLSHFLPALGHSNPRLRVLEVGAGTGAATAAALSLLRTDEGTRLFSKYYFTNISPGFISAAQEKFYQFNGIEYKILDITKDPQQKQGFAPHTFDLLRETLRRVHQLLAPKGWLLMQELSSPGMADDGRPDHAYTSLERWGEELRAVGFTGYESLAYDFEAPVRNCFTMLTRVAHAPTLLINGVTPSDWAEEVAHQFRNAGCVDTWIHWGDNPVESECIISLVNLDGPFLYGMDETQYASMQSFFQRLGKQRMFWVTRATQLEASTCSIDPRYAIVLGNMPKDVPRRLSIGAYGLINALEWVKAEKQSMLSSTDVQVDVHYVGYHGGHGSSRDASEFGVEGSGIVRQVALVTPGMFRTQIVVDQKHCRKLCQNGSQIDLKGAATMPSVYGTALWAFVHIANLRRDQSVLIHSACGEVGFASIRICQHIGARVRMMRKRLQYLVEKVGIPRNQIFNSRDTSFVEDLMRETEGRGADVVLNSLAGKPLHASWACVAEYGKMIEIGKRDFISHGSLSVTPFLENRSFIGMDMIHLQSLNSAQHEELLQEYQKWEDAGIIEPIRPTKVYSATDLVEAFRYMQTGKHMGKILIKMPVSPADIPCEARSIEPSFDRDAAYLLVGGLGGLGQAITTWMLERETRQFVFLSQSAGVSTEDQAFLAELDRQGCSTLAVAGSVTQLPDLKAILFECQLNGRRLAGDQRFFDMTFDEWQTTLGPKVQGTWNLHEALQGIDLDFFVLFGSTVATVGNSGQANYSAANCFLDAFAQYRRQQRLSCSVVHLGAVEDIGVVSRNARILDHARKQSIRLLQEKEVMEGVSLAILLSPSADMAPSVSGDSTPYSFLVGLANSRPTTEPTVHVMWDRDARFGIYYGLEDRGEVTEKVLTNHDRIRALVARVKADPSLLDEPEVEKELTWELGKQISENLLAAADMDEEQLANIAIDSLMAIEIKSATRRALGIDVTLVEIGRAGTVRGLVRLVIASLRVKYSKYND